MPLQSDIQINVQKFDGSGIDKETSDFNDGLIKSMSTIPKWWEIGAARFRQMRQNGETAPLPAAVESATNITLPSREAGRSIPCRVFRPEAGNPTGVFYHIHGGGWVLGSEAYQDVMLQHYADHSALVIVSVGYRLAPEHPYPAGNEDCFDIGAYLVQHATRDFGVPLRFLGGDSAGSHLSVLTCFWLLREHPEFAFRGLVLNFGAYNLSGFFPQVYNFKQPLVLDITNIQKTLEAYLPGTTEEDRRDMWISPFFADMKKMKLPPALFNCGDLDHLLDDSVMMSVKWMMSGAEGILKIYPGAPHGFTYAPIGKTCTTKACLDNIATFLNERSA